MTRPDDGTLKRFEDALAAAAVGPEPFYDLTLFVSGASGLSGRAIANARRLCELHLAGRYDLSVVDVHEEPNIDGGWLLAVPTLVKNLPLPMRKLVGDLSDTARVLVALDLPAAAVVPRPPATDVREGPR